MQQLEEDIHTLGLQLTEKDRDSAEKSERIRQLQTDLSTKDRDIYALQQQMEVLYVHGWLIVYFYIPCRTYRQVRLG